MNTKSLFGAAALAFAIASPTFAATYDFSFDASTATSGDTSMMAFGMLDIDAAAGSTFDNSDVSNVSITVTSDFTPTFTVIVSSVTSGSIAADGQSASFTDLFLGQFGGDNFGCVRPTCVDGAVSASSDDTGFVTGAGFASQAEALASFSATAQVNAVPLPAGGLLLLSGLAGVAGLKRRKKRAA